MMVNSTGVYGCVEARIDNLNFKSLIRSKCAGKQFKGVTVKFMKGNN
jgi:hypothetical protein